MLSWEQRSPNQYTHPTQTTNLLIDRMQRFWILVKLRDQGTSPIVCIQSVIQLTQRREYGSNAELGYIFQKCVLYVVATCNRIDTKSATMTTV